MMLAAILLPLLLGLLALFGGRPARIAISLAPFAALPGLWLALAPGEVLIVEGVLLGMTLGVDAISRPLLLVTALVWTASAWFAVDRIDRNRPSFFGFWLLTLFGLQLACLAADMVSFYCGYAVMSLAAWGLVIHDRDDAAHRAGRLYLVMMLISEVMVLAAIVQLAAIGGNLALPALGELVSESAVHASAFWLLLIGFGIKLGALPLHFWAPLADPAAPAPARAVLSGTLVKAGLLGWLRFLPPEMVPAAVDPANALLALGLAGAMAGALLALTQSRPRVILAYSTISQMGLMLAAFALSLSGSEARAAVLPVIALFVVHHGLIKAALFLGTGCEPGSSRPRLLMLLLPGLALAGSPLMGGYLVKALLKPEMTGWAALMLTWTSVTTTLLILHLVMRAWRQAGGERPGSRLHPAWPVLVVLALTIPWAWYVATGLQVSMTGPGLWGAFWPLLLGVGLFTLWHKLAGGRAPAVPAGDIVVVFENLSRRLLAIAPRLVQAPETSNLPEARSRIAPLVRMSEAWLRALPALGAVLLVFSVMLWVLLLR